MKTAFGLIAFDGHPKWKYRPRDDGPPKTNVIGQDQVGL